jgi:hypothetical protein
MSLVRSIQDLLPNEHILNFHAGRPVVPAWLGDNLKLIMGAGDITHVVPDVVRLSQFDVFVCQPWDVEGSLRENVTYLLTHYPKQKIICFLDIKQKSQVDTFCELFTNRFTVVESDGSHTPHLPISCLERVLKVGGTATNLFEKGAVVSSEFDLTTLLQKEVREINGAVVGDLLTTTRLLEYNNPATKENVIEMYRFALKRLIFVKGQENPSVKVTWNDLPVENEEVTLNVYKLALAVLLMYNPLPPTLKGVFGKNRRVSEPDREYMDIVVTKVAAGGGSTKKRKTRKSKKSMSR